MYILKKFIPFYIIISEEVKENYSMIIFINLEYETYIVFLDYSTYNNKKWNDKLVIENDWKKFMNK